MSGKDVANENRISQYTVDNQQVIKNHRNLLRWLKWLYRGISDSMNRYLNISSIPLANFWLLSLGKSDSGSLYFDL